jgi:molybdate transport system substrate-binding protein
MRMPSITIPVAAFVLTLSVGTATAAELRVLTPGGASAGVKPIAAEFARQRGTQVAVTAIQPYIVREKIIAGEPFDVVVQATPAMDESETSGLLRPGSRLALARGGIGVIVREGAPVPDVSTVEGFKRAFLNAKTIVIGDPNQANGAGPLIVRILANAGILEAVRAKFQVEDIVPGNELIAKGGADIGLFNFTAVPYHLGVKLAGPVPPPLQLYTSYDAAVLAKAAAPEPGLAFVKFMVGDDGRKAWIAARFETLPAP